MNDIEHNDVSSAINRKNEQESGNSTSENLGKANEVQGHLAH